MTCRRAALLLGVLAASGCGSGPSHQEPEPSGSWSLHGQPVSREQVESASGPAHCGWQAAQFLGLSWPPGRTYDDPRRSRLYVKDPEGVLDAAPYLRDRYRAEAALPPDAVDSGYRNSGVALWYSPRAGDAVVYLVRAPSQVEAWPKATTAVGCD